jgi:hypothetical protein
MPEADGAGEAATSRTARAARPVSAATARSGASSAAAQLHVSSLRLHGSSAVYASLHPGHGLPVGQVAVALAVEVVAVVPAVCRHAVIAALAELASTEALLPPRQVRVCVARTTSMAGDCVRRAALGLDGRRRAATSESAARTIAARLRSERIQMPPEGHTGDRITMRVIGHSRYISVVRLGTKGRLAPGTKSAAPPRGGPTRWGRFDGGRARHWPC